MTYKRQTIFLNTDGQSCLICTGCGIEKLLEEFRKVARNTCGRGQPCIECHKTINRGPNGIQRKPVILLYVDGLPCLACKQCLIPKPLDAFRPTNYGQRQPCKTCEIGNAIARYRDDLPLSRLKSRLSQQNMRKRNPERIRAREKAYWDQHRERRREQEKKRNANNRLDINRRAKERREAHLEEARRKAREKYAKDPEKYRAKTRATEAKKPEKYQALARLAHLRRKTRKRHLPSAFTLEERRFMLQYFGYACVFCGRQEGLFGWMLHDDHFIPLASPHCPGTVATNMLPVCGGISGCNQLKSSRDPKAWLIERFGQRKATGILKKIAAYFEKVRQRQHDQAS